MNQNFSENSFFKKDQLVSFLSSQKPIILSKNGEFNISTTKEFFQNNSSSIVIPPLNTDIRFSSELELHIPTKEEKIGFSKSHNFFSINKKNFYNPKDYEHNAQNHPEEKHIHENIFEEFSWAITTSQDSKLDILKKKLIKKSPSSQYACGSCWAVSFADTMSDCLVVSGVVNWSPNISATYIMMKVPRSIHNVCEGGNPAAVAKFLEKNGVSDTSCIDYSWCAGDEDLCKSVKSSSHFDSKTLAKKLSSNLPYPCGCYESKHEKYMYEINSGSSSFYINEDSPVDIFRNTVKTHILDFGPVIGGFVVLDNFISGIHTNLNLNGGVYFDRADYQNIKLGSLKFNDNLKTIGLHAISIVGWGIARNIQYDNDKWGDVPFWHCRNSWGKDWGKNEGFFRCAMYPFNKFSQFDKQVMTSLGGPVGSMILIRATKPPKKAKFDQISPVFKDQIKNKLRPNSYYESNTEEVEKMNRNEINEEINEEIEIIETRISSSLFHFFLLFLILICFIIFFRLKK